ncbi:tRNA sulfurtransferase [Salarchaeum japonicum]|uniref:Probable tRNA sulfurtransferase n=1 Tax=Salarchaeum japonicum TaxID=555573 RepID=A0AAV3SYK5_9EURY|nr:THUMP domain-containing protein [Salarchaeum japonicum]
MIPPGADTVLVRHGDVGSKSAKVQSDMERVLRENLERTLESRDIEAAVDVRWARIFARGDDVDAIADAATDAFGVVSASPCLVVDPSMRGIRRALANTAREHYDGGAFAVEARRAGSHDFTSQDIGRDGGEAVWEAVENDFQPEVDLDDPDITFFVECRDDAAYVFLEKRDGPGGLPLGTQRPLVALVSGGIDSPVAAYEAMKRGAPVIPVYLDLGPYGGPDHEARAIETVRRLSAYASGRDLTVHRVPTGPAVERVVEATGAERMLVYRRLMYRIAEAVAEEAGAVGVVTGEALGQKSSQTAANFAAVDDATTLPIHRPLFTRDKQDIVSQARDIGTFDTATVNAGCNRIAPDYPETNADPAAVRAAVPDDLPCLIETAVEDRDLVEVP